ncbi:efflux transporter outer membrane subunit [Oligoflexia bacterium]|nr:efflux transporter outer membrane subunit [Oligoflexia bacterium]
MKLNIAAVKFYLLICPLAFVLCSCTVHRVKEVALPDNLPEQFSHAGVLECPDRWWQSFEDETLKTLITEALQQNLSLQAAWARLEQAEALARKAGAAEIPELTFGGDVARARTNTPTGHTTANQFGLNLSVSYELDLWKRIASQKNAAALDAVYSRETLEATALALTAQVAESWYTVIEKSTQLKLLVQQQAASKTFLNLVELRFGQGQASAVEVYQQREQLASTETQIPLTTASLEIEQHRLAVLLGRTPDDTSFLPAEYLPGNSAASATDVVSKTYETLGAFLPAPPKMGLPASTLLKRPDLRAAQAKVAAADYRVAAAIADRFPALRVGRTIGYSNREASDLFSNWLWSMAGSLVMPIIDGGRRRAEVERSQAALKEALATFEEAVLRALQEIEDALSREYYQHRYLKRLETQLKYAHAAYDEARHRYAMGLTEYLPVLTELRASQVIERVFLGAQRDLIVSRINLLKALGAAWTSELEVQTSDAQMEKSL